MEEMSLKEAIEILKNYVTEWHETDVAVAIETVLKELDRRIPVEAIEEKINKINENEKKELKGTKGQDRYFIKQIYESQKNILRNLLKKE